MIYVYIELKWIIYILFVYILKPCLSCWESAAYCRYLEASYSRILNVWISQPLAKPVSSKRSLQNNDIITKIINDPIIASTLKCQCVCVCWGSIIQKLTSRYVENDSLPLSAPKSTAWCCWSPQSHNHLSWQLQSRCLLHTYQDVCISKSTQKLWHMNQISIHSALNQQLASASYCLSYFSTPLSPRTSGFIYKCRLFSTDDFPQLPKNCHLIHSKNVPNSEMFWKFCSSSSARRQTCCANDSAVEAPANLGTVGRPRFNWEQKVVSMFFVQCFCRKNSKSLGYQWSKDTSSTWNVCWIMQVLFSYIQSLLIMSNI